MDTRIVRIVDHLNSHFQQKISFGDMALMVNLSASRLRHIFRVELGISPAQYVKLLRLNRARELLETTFLSIKEIMVLTGMSDESHFFRDFKRAYNLTPVQYRDIYAHARPPQDIKNRKQDEQQHSPVNSQNCQ